MSLAAQLPDDDEDEPTTATKSKTAPTDGLLTRANRADTMAVLSWQGVATEERDGKTFATCPGCGEDGALVCENGGIKCLHERCSHVGPRKHKGFRAPVGIVAEVQKIPPADAAKLICKHFGIEVPKRAEFADDGPEHTDDDAPDAPPRGNKTAADSAVVLPFDDDRCPSVEWLSVDAVLHDDLPDVRLVVPELELGPGRPNGLQALGGSGKSQTAIDLGLSIATGTPAFGQFPVVRGKVRHISHELSKRAVLGRYRSFANGRHLHRDDFGDRLEVLCLPRLFLNSPGAEDHYLRWFDGCLFGIVDSLRRALPGADENASEMSNYLDILTRVSDRTGCTFLVLHHFGKTEQGDPRLSGRGSTAIMDGSGCIWSMDGREQQPRKMTLVRPGDDTDGDAKPFYLTMERVVTEPVFPSHRPPARLVWHDEDSMGEALAKDAVQTRNGKIERAEKLILETVRDNPGISKNRLEELIVKTKLVSSKPFRSLVDELLEREWLIEKKGARNASCLALAPVR